MLRLGFSHLRMFGFSCNSEAVYTTYCVSLFLSSILDIFLKTSFTVNHCLHGCARKAAVERRAVVMSKVGLASCLCTCCSFSSGAGPARVLGAPQPPRCCHVLACLVTKHSHLMCALSLCFSLIVEGPSKVLKVWLSLLEEEGFPDLVTVLEGSLWKDCLTEVV